MNGYFAKLELCYVDFLDFCEGESRTKMFKYPLITDQTLNRISGKHPFSAF